MTNKPGENRGAETTIYASESNEFGHTRWSTSSPAGSFESPSSISAATYSETSGRLARISSSNPPTTSRGCEYSKGATIAELESEAIRLGSEGRIREPEPRSSLRTEPGANTSSNLNLRLRCVLETTWSLLGVLAFRLRRKALSPR